MSGPRDPSEDFVPQLLAIFARCAGGFDEQLAQTIEEQIRDEFGGERVYVHRSGWANLEQRDSAIRAEREAGRSLAFLALKYGLSRSSIHKICAPAGQGGAA